MIFSSLKAHRSMSTKSYVYMLYRHKSVIQSSLDDDCAKTQQRQLKIKIFTLVHANPK